jgi:hypothetical protein
MAHRLSKDNGVPVTNSTGRPSSQEDVELQSVKGPALESQARNVEKEVLCNDIFEELRDIWKNKPEEYEKLKAKVEDFEDAVQPHTDEGGDPHYIGDAYEEAKCAHEWRISE